MDAEELPVDELAEAVLEGHLVDWASAESSPGAPTPEVVRELKVLAGIAELHRKITRDTPVAEQHRVPEKRLARWGRLEILERIGQGSFGEVFRAWDSKLDREVAVKLLHAGGSKPSPRLTDARGTVSSEGATGGPEGATVLEEARLLARVRHPNVVTVYDADEIDGRVGLWMEFIHGRNLEQVLGKRKRLDDREVTRVGIELCRALSAVHEAGLLHRDIKAQNLMQTEDGRLILMDFGTGRELEGRSASSSDTAGTPLYLAPEIFSGGSATVRADIYSAGVVLFHLLTGSYPVRGATIGEVGAAHARGERLELAVKASGMGKALAAVIGRAIEPDPSKRFESAREMLAALEKVQRNTQQHKAKRYGLALGVVTFAAIAFAVFFGMMRRNSGRDPKSQASGGLYFGSTSEKKAVQVPFALAIGTPSPDGRYLPFSEAGSGNLALYEFATGASRVLTHTGDGGDKNWATESIVSDDSSHVAYTWIDGACNCVQLRVVDAAGGEPRVLYGDKESTEVLPLEWSHDGRQILARRQISPEEIQVLLISVSDGSVRVVRTPHQPGKISLSPDDRHFAYDRAEDSNGTDSGIYVSAADGTGEVPVVTGPTNDSDPMWTPDGSALVFSSTRTGEPGLWLQRLKDGRADGRPRLLDKNMGIFAPVTLTQRGSLFYNHRTGLMDVYTVTIDPATGEVHGEPQNAASRSLGSNVAPDWSPDGRTLVFASWRTLRGPGRNILVFHSMDTGQERELALDMDRVNAPHWSPNGRVVAVFGPDRRRVKALRLIDVESGKVLSTFFPETADVAPVAGFEWSPEGRYAYLGRPSVSSIMKFDVSTGEETPVYEPPSDAVPNNFSLSPDGRWLAFVLYMRTAKTWRLIAIPTDGGPTRDVLQTPGRLLMGGWTRDGRQILYSSVTRGEDNKQQGELWAVPFAGGAPRRLGLSMPSMRDIRVSPDGTRVAFTSGLPDQGLWVFESFLPKTSP